MDAAYFSGLAALAGSVIGGLTSLGATWLTQHSQLGAPRFARNLERRETLYKDFINEASRLYADAFEHDQTELANLVKLFAMISQMRIVSAPRIAPNKTFGDFEGTIQSHTVDPLRLFSEACRDEMQQLGAFQAARASECHRPAGPTGPSRPRRRVPGEPSEPDGRQLALALHRARAVRLAIQVAGGPDGASCPRRRRTRSTPTS